MDNDLHQPLDADPWIIPNSNQPHERESEFDLLPTTCRLYVVRQRRLQQAPHPLNCHITMKHITSISQSEERHRWDRLIVITTTTQVNDEEKVRLCVRYPFATGVLETSSSTEEGAVSLLPTNRDNNIRTTNKKSERFYRHHSY